MRTGGLYQAASIGQVLADRRRSSTASTFSPGDCSDIDGAMGPHFFFSHSAQYTWCGATASTDTRTPKASPGIGTYRSDSSGIIAPDFELGPQQPVNHTLNTLGVLY